MRKICWHFAGATMRDGAPHPKPGVPLPTIANPVACKRGYHGNHGSTRLVDALQYAPGPWLAQVALSGIVIPYGEPTDKYCASDRVGLTPYVDVSEVLAAFARTCALRALRIHAPAALRAAGMQEHAARLTALPDDCDLLAAETAARAAAETAILDVLLGMLLKGE